MSDLVENQNVGLSITWLIWMFHFNFSKVPAFLTVVDIAGLVKGAHEGKGLGNAFLSNISACDAMFHCVSEYSSLAE